MYFLFLIFAIGVFLNADVLYERETQQASLERVNSIALSSLATSFLIFAILSFPKSKPINFMLNCICVVVSATVLALSQARGPILATLVALILYFFMVSASGRKNLVTVSAGAAILLVAVEFLSGGGFLIEAFARFYAVQDGGAGDSVTMRTVAWENSWYQFLDDPIFGKFMFETTFDHYPHNIFLESLIATGVIGTFFLLFHIILTMRASFFVLKSGNASLSHAFIVIIFLKETTQNMFSGALWGAMGFFIASACILGIAQHLSVAGNHDGGGRQFRIRK
jgi:O-antigen ligase